MLFVFYFSSENLQLFLQNQLLFFFYKIPKQFKIYINSSIDLNQKLSPWRNLALVKIFTNMIKEKKAHLDELHFEIKHWSNALEFYKNEITIFTQRLAEVSAKNSQAELKIAVEQFQNRLIINKNAADLLLADLRGQEKALVNQLKENAVAYERREAEAYGALQVRVSTFEKLFSELKTEFYQFLAKWF